MADNPDLEIVVRGGVTFRLWPDKRGNWWLYTRVGGVKHQVNRKTKEAVVAAIPEVLKVLGQVDQKVALSYRDARDYEEAKKLLEECGASLTDAARSHLATLEGKKVHRVKLRDAVADFIAEKKQLKLSDDYNDKLEVYSKKWVAAFGEVAVCDLEGPKLAKWLLSQDEMGARSKNNMRSNLATIINWCMNKGGMLKYGEPSPVRAIPTIKIVEEKIALMSPEQLDRLLEVCKNDREALLFCALACLTGIRSGELGRLNWEDLQIMVGMIEVEKRKSKTRARRLVDACPRLRKILTPMIGKDGERIFGRTHIERRFTGIAKKATWTDKPNSDLVLPGGWPRNAARHSWITYQMCLKKDAADVALEAGNSEGKVFTNYRSVKLPDGRLVTQTLARRWFGIPEPVARRTKSTSHTASLVAAPSSPT